MSIPRTSAERQDTWRKRQRRHVRLVHVEVSDDELLRLIDDGLLAEEHFDDIEKIATALKTKLTS